MTWIDGMDEHDQLRYAVGRLNETEALLSWVEGACVDELPHAEIRAAISRHRERADVMGDYLAQGWAIDNEGRWEQTNG